MKELIVNLLLVIGVLVFILSNRKKEKHDEIVDESNKSIIHNLEELKSLQEINTPEHIPKLSHNNIEYELPDINVVDNKKIKELIMNNKGNETIIPLGLCDNNYYYETLESMPSLIVGGTIMSGKSSFIHTIIGIILLCKKPQDTKLIICDSKMIEYNQYNGIPHLMCPVVSDSKQTTIVLKKMVNEIEKRYHMLANTDTKNAVDFNKYVERWNSSHSDEKLDRIPSIIIIIDDYDMFSNNATDEIISHIAKNGWKVNVFLIISSTHPSSEIMSSRSKSLIPARLCFKVTSSKDSILFLDDPIAGKLSGIGRAAYVSRKVSIPKQLDVQLLKSDEIEKIIDFAKKQQEASYSDDFMILEEKAEEPETDMYPSGADNSDDELYDQIVDFVVKTQKASASLLQRKFKIGYNKASTMIDELEENGIIGPPTGDSKPRKVLVQYRDENK